MNLIRQRLLSLLILATSSLSVNISAQEDPVAEIRAVIEATQPNMLIESIRPAPFEGMYQITLKNGQIINATTDARYFIPGDLYEALPQGLINRSEETATCCERQKLQPYQKAT